MAYIQSLYYYYYIDINKMLIVFNCLSEMDSFTI